MYNNNFNNTFNAERRDKQIKFTMGTRKMTKLHGGYVKGSNVFIPVVSFIALSSVLCDFIFATIVLWRTPCRLKGWNKESKKKKHSKDEPQSITFCTVLSFFFLGEKRERTLKLS